MRRDVLLDHFVVACLLIVSVITPWAMGGVLESWQFLLFIPLFLATLASLAIFMLRGQAGPPIPVLAWPLLFGIAIAASYLAPLPAGVLAHLSPRAHGIWAEVDRDMAPLSAALDRESKGGESKGGEESHVAYSVSLVRRGTRSRMGFLVLAVAALVLANRHLECPRKRRLFFMVIAINGIVLTLFGVIQALTFNGKLFWMLPLGQGGNPFAAFVNRNNAAGYLNLCLGAAIALAVKRHLERRPEIREDGPRGGGRFPPLDRATWGWSLAVVLLTAGVFCSLSRGGALSLLVAALATAWGTRHSALGRSARWATGAAVGLGLGFAAWLGRGAILRDRVIQSFAWDELSREGRLHNWQDALASGWEFFPLGSGLGSYRYVYLFHEDSLTAAWFQHAENQYLETLVELGLPGVALVLLAIVLVLRAVAPWFRGGQAAKLVDAELVAAGTAGLFVIVSQVVHAGFDFGLLIPSNMLLFAMWCGLLSAGPVVVGRDRPRGRRVMILVVLVSIAGGLAWSGWELFRDGQSMQAIRASLEMDEQGVIGSQTIQRHVASLEAQLARRPGEPQLCYYLARLHTLGFRAATYDELTRRLGAPDERRWPLTAATELHARWNQLGQGGSSEELAQLRHDAHVRRYLAAAARDLSRSLQGMPLRPQAYLRLAEVGGFFVDPEQAQVYVARAKQLAPADADILYQAGILELQAQQVDEACTTWQRCLEGSTQHNRAILMIAKQQMSPQQFGQLLPDDPGRIIQIATAEFSGIEDQLPRHLLAEAARERLESTSDDSPSAGTRSYLKGRIHALLDDPGAAMVAYRRALDQQPGQTRWRAELVTALIRQGHWKEALAEARKCEQQAPRELRYRLQVQQIERKMAPESDNIGA